MEKTLLEVKNLKKYFSTSAGPLHAVDSISFKLRRGTTLGVVGESGCGKSTLGRLILHLLPVTDGQIFYDGEDITNPNRKKLRLLRRNMQMVFQDPYSSLNPRQTVADIIGEPLVIYKVSESKKDLGIRTRDIMEIVGLPSRYETTYPHELDGGRRQRVGLGRAIALNPQLIVCDEPVSALDVSIQAQILNLLQDLQKQLGLTYLFITHDLSVVKHFSDEIMVMYLGVMVEKAQPMTCLNGSSTLIQKRFSAQFLRQNWGLKRIVSYCVVNFHPPLILLMRVDLLQDVTTQSTCVIGLILR